MKKIFYLFLIFSFFSCVNKNTNQEKLHSDSIKIYHKMIDSLEGTISSLNDTILQIKNKNANIEKFEIVKLSDFKQHQLYTKHCKFCHGEYGEGDGIKARVNKELCPFDLSKEQKSDQEVYYIILNGLDKMPAQKDLKTEDVWVLIVYIKQFKK